MKTRTRRPSRRDFLKTTAWAAPLALSGVAFPVSKVSAATASDVLELGARAAVDRIRKGEMKCEDYMGRLFAHYEANKNLNPWVSFNPSRALSAARAVDQARAKGDKLGMLAGLPIAVKDNLDVAGFPTAIGNRALLGNIAKQSATVIATVEKHGAIVIAKANMSQFGGLSPSGATSNNRHFGQPRNPYNPAHISGGSSGGPGTAVSARFVPAAFGEDSGGSVRFPASASGIVGMRPSTGGKAKRYSDAGFMPPPTPDTKTVGPLARTMADLAFLDTAVTGDAVRPVKLAEVRIGIPDASYWDTKIYEPAVRKITEEAYAKLRAAGANLVEVHLDTLLDLNKDDRLSAPRGNTRQIFADWVAKNLPGVTLEQIYDPLLGSSGPGGSGRPNPATVTAEQHAQMLTAARRTYADFFKQHGLFAISFPTLLFPAPLENVNGDTPGQKILVGGKWVDEYDHIIINLFWNARLGVPGISLPSGMTNGLPVGLEFDSMIGEDSRLLGLGMSAENVLGVLPPPPIIGNA